MAAGVLIAQEAGGVTGWAEDLTPKCLVAANPALFAPIQSMLNALG